MGASQHCPKLDTLHCNLCFFERVPQERRQLNVGTGIFLAVPGEPLRESCRGRTAVCLRASMAGWELGPVLRNSWLCGFACGVNPKGMFILSDVEKQSL